MWKLQAKVSQKRSCKKLKQIIKDPKCNIDTINYDHEVSGILGRGPMMSFNINGPDPGLDAKKGNTEYKWAINKNRAAKHKEVNSRKGIINTIIDFIFSNI
jgi:hypothetical protein